MAVGSFSRAICSWHAAAFTWSVVSLWQNCVVNTRTRRPSVFTYGGRWKFLTFINQVLQCVLFGVCFFTDLCQLFGFGKKEGVWSRLLLLLRDCIFSVLAFPVGTFVVASFWSIYAYDRELIYPEKMDAIIPQWLNHSMHTVVLPLLLLELFICFHQYPRKKKGLLGLASFSFVYLSWILWIKYVSGFWVYPILEKLDAVAMVVFFAACILILASLYHLGEFLTKLCWDL
ncbi:androgen-induced gene 1 protein-like isoform X2 [Rhinatrema bivittatum]|uniref:androgen-induced gene 1 protein-like isoform X2 n=1 Tax=Rhinatrema bivittatum TaxID=194408 RepID=UPI001127CBB5|nr:androgen-induced gene 1 protein-like isoform X2 [Rhinatrema bivittatum]